MGFNDLYIKPIYDSQRNDIVGEFYNPILNEAIEYNRVSAYFSIKTLLNYAKGLASLFNSDGIARFIISIEISEEDYNIIKDGYELKELRSICDDLDMLKKQGMVVDLENLAFLISIGKVDIRIALRKKGLFHDKFGVFKDNEGNHISFRGSINETTMALNYNYESFEVNNSINSSLNERLKINRAVEDFNKMWNDNFEGLKVISFPDAIRRKLLEFKNDEIKFFGKSKPKNSNELILDFDGEFIVKYDYSSIELIENRLFKLKIKPYISLIKEGEIFFIKLNSYMKIKKLIEHFKKYASKQEFEIILSRKLIDYLAEKDIQIFERRKLGTYIKNRENDVLSSFYDFKKVVSNIVERPLMENQLWDAFHVSQLMRASNFSVPGTGKTAMILGSFAYLKYKEKVNQLVVIGPISAFKSWKDEINNVYGKHNKLKVLDITEYKSDEKKYAIKYRGHMFDVILINYDALQGLSKPLCDVLDKNVFLCFDEIHKIKNPDGKRAEIALEISKKPNFKVALTGTPIPNGFVDMYNLLNILYTDEYEDFFGFEIAELKNIQHDSYDFKQFNDKLQPFFCRTTKNDLKINPPNPDNVIKIELSEDELLLYKMIVEKFKKHKLTMYIRLIQAGTLATSILDTITTDDTKAVFGFENDYISDINDCELSRQIENASMLFEDVFSEDEKNFIRKIGRTQKFDTVMSKIVELNKSGKPVLVWANFIKSLNEIQKELKKRGINSKIINGSVPISEREIIIEDYKNRKFDVLIANPQTMAESVSLHMVCHDAVYMEYDFNLTHMLQSRDRIHRLGLDSSIETNYFYFQNVSKRHGLTLDELMYNKLQEKLHLMLKLIESNLIDTIEFDSIDELLELII